MDKQERAIERLDRSAGDLAEMATAAVKLGVDGKDFGRKLAAKLKDLPPEMLAAMLDELKEAGVSE